MMDITHYYVEKITQNIILLNKKRTIYREIPHPV